MVWNETHTIIYQGDVKMKMKKLSVAALSLAATMAVTACSGGASNSPAPEGSTAPAVTPAAGGEKIKLTMTSWRPEQIELDTYKKLFAEFQKTNPNIEFEYKPVKATEYNTTLATALKTDSAADIIMLRPYAGAKTMADAGYLEPLDGVKGLDQYSPDQLKVAQGTDGKQYGVPFVLSTTSVVYNKKIFADNNLQEPKTWDEFIKLAEDLKAKKITPFAFGSKEAWILSLTHGALGPAFYGKDFADKFPKGEVKLADANYKKSIEMMNTLIPYFPNNFEGIGMDEMRSMFATEQAAMMVMGQWEFATLKQMNPALDIDVFPVPSATGGQPTVTTWVDGSWGVNAKSKNKEAAKKWMEFLSTKEFATVIANDLKLTPAVPGVQANDPLANKILQLSASNPTPYLAVMYMGIGTPTGKGTLENSLQGMYLKKLSVDQVIEETQKVIDNPNTGAAK